VSFPKKLNFFSFLGSSLPFSGPLVITVIPYFAAYAAELISSLVLHRP
jgi:hypothetical protein